MKEQRFRSTIQALGKSHAVVPVPFDPAKLWGERDRYLVRGTIEGCNVRGSLEERAGGWVLPLGAAWRRDSGFDVGAKVDVMLHIEGPQRDALAPDFAAALDAEPEAARFWDALAQFYTKAYLRWIDATKRSPETRALRIAETVRCLKAGRKERPC
jgi:hypothetical protein